MKKIIQFLMPPPNWRVPVIILSGLFTGLFIYAAVISNAISYLSDDPKVCINCHIMVPQYSTWQHSSHKNTATCNDCHVPHDNIFNKYYFKAKDGLRHAAIFTIRGEAQAIQITDASKSVVQENCKRCHTQLNEEVLTLKVTNKNSKHGQGKLCFECHREVPHGRINSLSSVPNAKIQLDNSNVPDWISEHLKKSNNKTNKKGVK